MVRFHTDFDGFDTAVRMEEGLLVLVAIYLAILLFSLAISVAVYVIQSIGLYGMSKNAGVSKPWLAWIPIGNLWCMGSLAERSNLYYGKGKGAWSKLLPAFAAAVFLALPPLFLGMVIAGLYKSVFAVLLLLFVYLILMGVALALSVMTYVALYKIYRLFDPDRAVLYLILSIFVNVSQPVILFLLRNRFPGGGKTPPVRENAELDPPCDPNAF